METWLLWEDSARSPFFNMAADELLLTEAPGRGRAVLRFYDWDRPSISFGYTQDYEAARRDAYTAVRRPTGGGIVFHDSDLTYSIAVPAGHPICALDRMESYHVFHRAVLRLLEDFGKEGSLSSESSAGIDRATMRCFQSPTRYDVLCGSGKVAGAAQRRTRDGILHQGSVQGESLAGVSKDSLKTRLKEKIALELGVEFEKYIPPAGFVARAETLAARKYAAESWNRDKVEPSC
jgi:lipoate-protein ligase A